MPTIFNLDTMMVGTLIGRASRGPLALPTLRPGDALHRRVDRGEFGVELRADALHGGDDRKGDAAGDQAIFDRGGAGFVRQEFRNQRLDDFEPFDLRDVTAILDDLDPGIGNAPAELSLPCAPRQPKPCSPVKP